DRDGPHPFRRLGGRHHQNTRPGRNAVSQVPAGTVRIDGQFLCAHVAGLPFTPCARGEKIDYRSFRSSLVGLSFAYCDFYQRNSRSHLVGERDWLLSAASRRLGQSSNATMPALHRRLNTSQKGNCVATSNSEQTVSMLGHIYACRLFFLIGVLSMADENEVKQVQEPTQEQQQQQSTEQQPTEPPPPEP